VYERFSDRARKVMELADVAARRMKHEYLGTDHILLGLIDEGGGAAIHVLRHLGIEPGDVAARVTEVLQSGPGIQMRRRPWTPRAKHVIELAIVSAIELGDDCVGTQHVLLGLIREDEGVAGVVLQSFVSAEDVCAALQNLREALPGENLDIPKKPFPCGLASLLGLTAAGALLVWLSCFR
jgi:ATP-dependent Clp protease ATP-binding subunit ClpC